MESVNARTRPFQPSLFGSAPNPALEGSFAALVRIQLDATSWVDHAQGWVSGSDTLFEQLVSQRPWGQRRRDMYEKSLLEPRLTAPWSLASGEPLEPALLEEMRRLLSVRYGVTFDSIGFNLYRDGNDSVAWHGDWISPDIAEPVVALVSLGEPRTFLLRPRGGGRSLTFQLGRGDLLVTGGETQRTWEHAVPKVARAGPRVSLAFRYGLAPPAGLYSAP